ncbi:hypothetical protein ACRS5S_31930 [Nocardia asiatica]|uniref:hypothetical protein n=1 Tax=Nocardia asiatica TaxID=209252 RepID=UPI003EE3A06C
MAYTGLRIGECSALRVKSLDLDGLHVRVFEAFTDVKGKLVLGLPKGDKKRTLDLVPDLVDELRAHVKGKRPTCWCSHLPAAGRSGEPTGTSGCCTRRPSCYSPWCVFEG